jgi:hypothetical protein
MSRQDQKVDERGLALQAGGDIVVHGGISPEQMSEIMVAIARTVATFTDAALEKAVERMDALRDEILKRFAEAGQADPEAFKDPDFQYMLNDAQKAVARSGDAAVRDTLVDLVARRSLEKGRTRIAITLAEAATKVANLTSEEFAALSLAYLVRYTIDRSVNNLATLGTYIQTKLVPFAKAVSKERSSYWHLQSQSCANIEMGEVDILAALTRAYGGVLGDGFTREQLESHLPDGKKDAFDPFLMQCINNGGKLQPRALNFQDLKDNAGDAALTENELRNVWNVFENTINDASARITSVAPDAPILFDAWAHTPLKHLTLTSVGIAVAHAHAVRVIDLKAPLNIWIK